MENKFNLKNKIILITGGAGRIGSAIAEEALDLNAHVVLIDFNIEKLKELSERLSKKYKKITTICDDLNSQEAIKNVLKKVLSKVTKIDAAIHCMYPISNGFGDGFEDLNQDNLFQDLNMQLGLAILFSQQILKQFKSQGYGDLIHISSIQGVQPPKFRHYENTIMNSPIEYSAIKSGIISITRWLAKYYKNQKIRVNCVSPGGIKDSQPDEFIRKYREDCTNIGMLTKEQVASAIIFLLTPAAIAINGQNLIVDDGWTL